MKSLGKSKSRFYYSTDSSFIIKTITEKEADFFLSFLFDYYQFLLQNPKSKLVK